MKRHPLLAAVLLTVAASASLADDKSEDGLTVTLGVERSRSSATGESTDKPEVSPLFGLDYRSGRFFASTSQGIGYELWKTDLFSAFAALAFQPGRKESKAGDKKDNPRLVGMGRVQSSGLLMLGFGAAPLDGLVNLNAVLLKPTRSEQGLTAAFGAGVGFPVWGPVSGSVEVGATYADRKHMQTFFGVTSAQSLRSGNPVFTPKAGLMESTVSLGLNWEIDKQWSASASVGRMQRMGDAKKSPLFKTKNDTSASVSVSYRF
jgi:outer membrane scaffolding protein for murein synthesis (MipA/OmpV family)